MALEIATVADELKAGVEMWSTTTGQQWKAVSTTQLRGAWSPGFTAQPPGGIGPRDAKGKGPATAGGMASPSAPQQAMGATTRKRGAAAMGTAPSPPAAKLPALGAAATAAAAAAERARQQQAAAAAYTSALRPLQFADQPLLAGPDFYFRNQAKALKSSGNKAHTFYYPQVHALRMCSLCQG